MPESFSSEHKTPNLPRADVAAHWPGATHQAPHSRPKSPFALWLGDVCETLSWRWKAALAFALIASWLGFYLCFRSQIFESTPLVAVLGMVLVVAELLAVFQLCGNLYALWPRQYRAWRRINSDRDLQFNLFICTRGEAIETVRETIVAARETIRVYSELIEPLHAPRLVVLNDGKAARCSNWREVEALCAQLEVTHIARDDNKGGKAGNINHGLALFAADNTHRTLDVIFDFDCIAKAEFLVEIARPFGNAAIDWVQSARRYRDEKTWVAKAAGAQQSFFFDSVCPAQGNDKALPLCEGGFAIRRSALDAVGGLDTRHNGDSYATSLALHLKGRCGVLMPQVLALSSAPISLRDYFARQKNQSRHHLETTRDSFQQLVFGALSNRQKLHYLLLIGEQLSGARNLILLLAPLAYLWCGVSLIQSGDSTVAALIYAPPLLARVWLQTKMRFPIQTLALKIISFPASTIALWEFITRKAARPMDSIRHERDRLWTIAKAQIALIVALVFGLIFRFVGETPLNFDALINFVWAILGALFLLLGLILTVVSQTRAVAGTDKSAEKSLRVIAMKPSRLSLRLPSPRGFLRRKMRAWHDWNNAEWR